MNCCASATDSHRAMIGEWLADAGACAWGVTAAEPLPESVAQRYRAWIADGQHGEMAYLERYDDVRSDPRLLLEGAQSIISCAFAYTRPQTRGSMVASYALGLDYHNVLRNRLKPVAEKITTTFGAACRICVDTAPLRERWHAQKAAVGFIGRNGLLIVPSVGSCVFLAEILTTAALPPSSPCTESCRECNCCVKACPGHALHLDGSVDARRCHSYLTIEYRGDVLPDDVDLRGAYGCDECQRVCPHNRGCPPTVIPEFQPRPELLDLTRQQLATLTPQGYKTLTKGSAMARAKLHMLLRNAKAIKECRSGSSPRRRFT